MRPQLSSVKDVALAEPPMPRRDEDRNFIEAIARGFDVIKTFAPAAS